MAVMEISISPRRREDLSVGRHLREAMRVLHESGLRYEIHAMGTLVQGDPAQLFEVAQRMHEVTADLDGVERVVTSIKLDERHDKQATMESKVRSLQDQLDQS